MVIIPPVPSREHSKYCMKKKRATGTGKISRGTSTGILLSLGINELSMNARAIPIIKKIIRTISIEEVRADFENVMRLSTAKEVQAHVSNRMKILVPELSEKGYLEGWDYL